MSEAIIPFQLLAETYADSEPDTWVAGFLEYIGVEVTPAQQAKIDDYLAHMAADRLREGMVIGCEMADDDPSARTGLDPIDPIDAYREGWADALDYVHKEDGQEPKEGEA